MSEDRSRRLTRNDWLTEGLKVLREQGPSALTIEGLCHRMGVTKGSFYHHFRNREELSQALLEEWERRLTSELIEGSRQGADFATRSERLTQEGLAAFDPALELAVRVWAQQEPMARAVQERVDRRRVAYLTELFSLLTRSGDQAEDLAVIRYAFSIGAQQVLPALEPERYARLLAVLESWLEQAALGNHAIHGGEDHAHDGEVP
jgi:AcrR family transcriptional regulator